MAKYRKKPVEIEAIQFKGGNMAEINDLLRCTNEMTFSKGTVKIKTLEGTMTATKGDYIIKGVNGELKIIDQKMFEKEYEKV